MKRTHWITYELERESGEHCAYVPVEVCFTVHDGDEIELVSILPEGSDQDLDTDDTEDKLIVSACWDAINSGDFDYD